MVEKKLLIKILETGDLKEVLNNKISETFFAGILEKKVFIFITEFWKKYNEVPAKKVIEEKFPDFVFDIEVLEPLGFLIQEFKNRELYNRLKFFIKESLDFLKEKDVENAYKMLSKSLIKLNIDIMSNRDFNWVKNVDTRKQDFLDNEKYKGLLGIKTGWKSLDDIMLGFQKEHFIVVVARAGIGKTWFLCLTSYSAWLQKQKVLFISMEMPEKEITRRLDAIRTGIPYGLLRKYCLNDSYKNLYFRSLENLKKHNVDYIITSDPEIKDYSIILSKIAEYKPDIVFIDGVYLLIDNESNKNKVELIYALTQNLKRFSKKFNIPIIVSSQMKRGSYGGKGGEDRGALVAWSDSFFQDADEVIELIQTEDMREAREMRISLVKQREGQKAHLIVNWDFENMNFTEKDLSSLNQEEIQKYFLDENGKGEIL